MTEIEKLVDLLQVEPLEQNLFRGVSADIGSRNVFGGQVLGQALMAAARTVEGRRVHSMHAYFLRPGDKQAPIVYDVERIRDGSSFTTRRVVAIQHGRPIFNTSISFQIDEPGAEHQDPMPEVPGPEGLASEAELLRQRIDSLPQAMRAVYRYKRPIEIRPIEPVDPFNPVPRPARFTAWVRAATTLPDEATLHYAMLAYASDFNLLQAALLPHGLSFIQQNLHLASLDHAMWFHRDFRMDDWLLYVTDSPSASNARGLCFGRFYSRDGRLVATTAQEGLLRQHPDA